MTTTKLLALIALSLACVHCTATSGSDDQEEDATSDTRSVGVETDAVHPQQTNTTTTTTTKKKTNEQQQYYEVKLEEVYISN